MDQHFLERRRFNRLLGTLRKHPEKIGVGIDESTAVVVTAAGWRVIGASQVLVLIPRKEPDAFELRVLSAGDVWKPAGGR